MATARLAPPTTSPSNDGETVDFDDLKLAFDLRYAEFALLLDFRHGASSVPSVTSLDG